MVRFVIAFRLIQGAAAALEERGAAIGSWASWGAVAAGVGPLVAGVFIAALSWRSMFFLPLPLVVGAATTALVAVEESRDETVGVRQAVGRIKNQSLPLRRAPGLPCGPFLSICPRAL